MPRVINYVFTYGEEKKPQVSEVVDKFNSSDEWWYVKATKSGEKRLTLLSGEIVDLEGTTCFVMVLRDVTELKSLEFTAQ